ncbi:MAG: hypothetical protein M3Y57_19325 [Acidobacteriota bacterium]|nr:hypothetical protein [Acidobacteriota bacterium]
MPVIFCGTGKPLGGISSAVSIMGPGMSICANAIRGCDATYTASQKNAINFGGQDAERLSLDAVRYAWREPQFAWSRSIE